MAMEVLLPLMGEGVHEASLVNWLKKIGEKIEKDEPLLEVSTDKVDTEIQSPFSGYLIAIYAKAGDIIKVDQVIAHLGETPEEKAPAMFSGASPNQGSANLSPNSARSGVNPTAAERVPTDQAQPTRHQSSLPRQTHGFPGVGSSHAPMEFAGMSRSSPLVRKMALEQGIDLRLVSGSGLHGRITKEDVEAYLSGNGPTRFAQMIPGGSGQVSPDELLQAAGGIVKADMAAFRNPTKVVEGREVLEGVEVRRESMSKMRRLIADHMVQSIRTSAHVTTTIEIDMHNVVEYRKKIAEDFAQSQGFKLTFTPFFLAAAIDAIKKDMTFNCSLDGYDILWKEDINLGCAVAIEDGLIVPVIKKAQNLSLTEIAQRLNDLAKRARSKSLKPDEVKGGTFSVTNPGMFGCLVSTPIINQPQVAIMSVGAIVKRPVVLENDMIAVRPIASIGITFDHRVIDGEGGAKFLANLKKYLENGFHS